MTCDLTTTDGERYPLPTYKQKELQHTIMQACFAAMSTATSTNQATAASVADEIAKLHALCQQGIITQAKFDKKKRDLLGI